MKTILRTMACLVIALLAGIGVYAAIGDAMVGHWGRATGDTAGLILFGIPSATIVGAFVVMYWGVFPAILRPAVAFLAGIGMYAVTLNLLLYWGLGRGNDGHVVGLLAEISALVIAAFVLVNSLVFPRLAKAGRGESDQTPGRMKTILRTMASLVIALLAGRGMFAVTLNFLVGHRGLGKGDTALLIMFGIPSATVAVALVLVNSVVFPRFAEKAERKSDQTTGSATARAGTATRSK